MATVSCIYGIGDPADYHAMVLHLRVHENLGQRSIIQRLVEMQYERNDLDFKRGGLGWGDIIDVYPSENSELGLRISQPMTKLRH